MGNLSYETHTSFAHQPHPFQSIFKTILGIKFAVRRVAHTFDVELAKIVLPVSLQVFR